MRQRSRVPGEIGERRADDQDRLAERDDDEQAAALGDVGAFDHPVGGRRAAEARHPETKDGRKRIRCPAPPPTDRAGDRIVGQAAEDPERRGRDMPDDDAQEVEVVGPVVALERPQHEQVARHLHAHIGERERPGRGPRTHAGSTTTSRARPASARTAACRTGRPSRIEPVGDPGGVDPDPPDRDHQQAGLQGAERRRCLSRPCESCVTANTNTRSKNSST